MKTKIIFAAVFSLIASSALFGSPAQVEFSATLLSVVKESAQVGRLSMDLGATTLEVRVTGLTEILDENNTPLTLAQLESEIGTVLEVEGIFTRGGILADRIKLAEENDEFVFRGRIAEINAAAREIRVMNFVIKVPADTEIKDQEGNPLSFSDLRVSQFVQVEGLRNGTVFEAREIKIRFHERKSSRIVFEGTITALSGTNLNILIEGVDSVLVKTTPDTRIHGTLAVGALVRVIGIINGDLTVTAHTIIVQQPVRLAPEKLRMGLEMTRRVEVVLRTKFDVDVTLQLSSTHPAVAAPSGVSLTIPAGKVAGFFEVKSAATPGETMIRVQLPASLGGFTAELPVVVADAHDKAARPLKIEWRPQELRLGTGDSRTVQLRLSEPAPAPITIILTLKEGAAGSISFPATVNLAAGERVAELTLTAGTVAGAAKLEAALPASVGGDKDELEVKIR
ncbi:MAG: hypothetical protein HY645_01015 [Acidobacteria bacterium]|nr:hypothetical protein [Acidobacteriota bacterium]